MRLKKFQVLNLVLIVVLIGAGYFGFKTINPRTEKELLRTAFSTISDVTSVVTASGSVQSTTNIGLSFRNSGIVTAIQVKVGDKVTKGQLLGKTGAEGNVSGPHLHMEIQDGPGWKKASGIDPKPVLEA